ncbi:hypothetical protein EJV47_05395 [Hymenobacter gummosus]|uniref:Outer membrane protein beta-barrel domain-containing protein n=1 Tax=Hymenobacter gummosus TaxID=1776032 RepID=A0A431U6Z0_9BACT|nr:hypothetical protein [Hymenobacter gummosus]RTQ52448.1 hypothetical protein EJV47_05395 [Hymenobacter gummosus]
MTAVSVKCYLIGAAAWCLCAVSGHAQTQVPAPDKRNLLSLVAGPTVFRVQPGEQFFLPNDRPRFNAVGGVQYTRWLDRLSLFGLRLGAESTWREGRFSFNGQPQYRRERFLLAPAELVVRYPPRREEQQWRVLAFIGGYYSLLQQRTTYVQTTAGTDEQKQTWIYGMAGTSAGLGLVRQGANAEHHFGIRVLTDGGSFKNRKSTDPAVRYESLNLYYNLVNIRW